MKTNLLIFFLLSSFIINAQNFQKGPYIIYTNNTSEMKLLWQLDTSLQCTIKWGTVENNYTNSVVTTESGSNVYEHQHSYLINGLNANQKYYYQIIAGSDTINSNFLSAQNETNTETVFFAYGDTRSYPESQDLVTTTILSEINTNPSSQTFLLHAGDWTSSDTEENWNSEFFNRNYLNTLALQSKLPLMGCRGNHEGSAIQYNKYFPYQYNYSGDYYSFDYGLVHISVVDLYTDFSDGSAQLNWLQNDLASSNKTWKFVLLHEPAYTDTTVHKDNIDVQNYIVPVCHQNNVKVIFGGHNHFYAHCFVDSIHHLTLGGGGAPLYSANHLGVGLVKSESTLHFAKITANISQATISIIKTDSSIVDTFTIYKQGLEAEEIKDNKFDVHYSTGNINITQPENKLLEINVINSSGQTLIDKSIKNKKIKINVSNLKPGIYIVSVTNEKEKLVKKILIH